MPRECGASSTPRACQLSNGVSGILDRPVKRAMTDCASGNFPKSQPLFPLIGRTIMARKYSKKASADVKRTMKKRKAGTLRSGRSKKKVTSRKQAIAIGLSEARAEGKKVPKKAAKKRKTAKKKTAKKSKRKAKK
jgi:hypothetical protein